MAGRELFAASETDVPASNPLLDHAGFLLRRAQLAVFEDFNAQVAAFDLRPSEFSVMSVVAHNPRIRFSHVGELIGVKLANLSPLVAGLEERGLLVRHKDEDDRRVSSLALTTDGRRLMRAVDQAVTGHLDRLAALLGQARYDELLISLRLLISGLDQS